MTPQDRLAEIEKEGAYSGYIEDQDNFWWLIARVKQLEMILDYVIKSELTDISGNFDPINQPQFLRAQQILTEMPEEK